MPVFSDGSRIWLADVQGREMPEYSEESGTEERTDVICEWRKVYIKAEIGKAFAVHYKLAASDENKRRLEVNVDGTEAADIDVLDDAAGSVQGWSSSAEKINRFAFGKLDLIEEDAAAKKKKKASQVHDDPSEYLLEVLYYDAVVDGPRKGPPAFRKPILAPAVRADGKVAEQVGCQIKTGWVLKHKPQESNSAGPHLEYKQGAIEYSTRFIYRTEKALIALGVIEAPTPPAAIEEAKVKTTKRKRKDAAVPKKDAPSAGEAIKARQQRTKRSEAEKKGDKSAKPKASGVTKRKQSKGKQSKAKEAEDSDDASWDEGQEARKRAAKRKAAQKRASPAKPAAGKPKVSKTPKKGENSTAAVDGEPDIGHMDSHDDLFGVPNSSVDTSYVHA